MKKSKTNIETKEKVDIFNQPWTHYIMIGVIVVIISTLFFNVAFRKLTPQAHDTQEWRWAAEQSLEYNKNNKGSAIWTDNVFSGMPTYVIQFSGKYPYLYNIFNLLRGVINLRIFMLIFGGLGMYVLLVMKKFSPLVALFSAISFALSCHFIGLIEIGHNTKFRAIMYIPWVFLTFDELRIRRSLLAVGLLSIFMIDQFRMFHIQISYYTFLMIGIYWFVYLIKNIREKKYIEYAHFTGLLFLSIVITIMAVANPYFSLYEYSHLSQRGAAGLSREYATGWSFGIGEVLSFLVPNFYGGISPLYWGTMPFTQNFHYFGILILFMGILASVFCFKETKVKALIIIAVITLLISFGKNLPFLSNFLLNHLPYFNRFRVPGMILCIVQFVFPVLAAYGLKLCLDNIKQKNKILNTTLFISLIGSTGLLCLFMSGSSIFSTLEFTTPADARYQPAQLENLKELRLEALLSSGVKSFSILTAGILFLFIMVKGYLSKNIVLIILIGLTVTDLTFVNSNHLKKETLVHENSIQRDFPTLTTDEFLLSDDDLFRIFPFHEFGTNRWSYYHQNIGGYSAAKLNRYNEVIERNLFRELIAGVSINWNVINMLNVKYLILNFRAEIPSLNIDLVHHELIDRNKQYATYLNHGALPRAWFVKKHEVISNTDRISLMLNNPDFNPRDTVILEKTVDSFDFKEEFTIELLDRSVHNSTWKTSNDTPAFMVISEIYYPAGWNFYINGVKTDDYAANYILRGIRVPAGENIIEMKFEPPVLKLSYALSLIGILTSVLITLFGVFLYYNANYGKGTVYMFDKKKRITLK